MSKSEKVKKPFYKKVWFWVIAIIVIIAAASSGGTETPTSSETATPAESKDTSKETTKESKKEPEVAKQFAIGEEVKVGDLSYTVKTVEETDVIENILGNKTTEGKFVIIELTIKNHAKKARIADTNMFKIKTSDDSEYSADPMLDMYVNEDGLGFFLEDINPNLSKAGKVVFELPIEATEYNLEVSSGFGWSGGDYEKIKLK